MKDKKLAEVWVDENGFGSDCNNLNSFEANREMVNAFLAGLKAGRPQWHKITDWEDNNQFPDNDIKTYLVLLPLYQYVVCELDITEGYRQFWLEDGLEPIDPQDVIAWCEITIFDKENE